MEYYKNNKKLEIMCEIAKKLKEKGFPQSPDYFNYNNYYEWDGLRKIHPLYNVNIWFDNINKNNLYFAPTISQVLKWLRKEKEIMVFPVYSAFTSMWYCSIVNADSLDTYKLPISDSYEEAALAGIEYVLDNLL